MTSPENPEPRPFPHPVSIQTFPRMGRGIRWSDLVAEMQREHESKEEPS